MWSWINLFCRARGGATALELALLVAFIALACVAVLQQIGEPQRAAYKKADQTIQKAAKPAFGNIK